MVGSALREGDGGTGGSDPTPLAPPDGPISNIL